VENRHDPLIGVLISGRGSNLQALIAAILERRLRARIRVVISNVAGAPGLHHAESADIERLVLPHHDYSSREAYDEAVAQALRSREVELVCLAGFMRRLSPVFCDAFPEAILNIHPSLLPAFPGINAQRQALEHGVKLTGATVHFVTPDLDSGPIVVQQAVPVMDSDDTETLSARVLVAEHEIYPRAVERILHESWRIVGRRVVFENGSGRVR